MVTQDPLLFGNNASLSGPFGVARDTCLNAPGACIPANNLITVRAIDGLPGTFFQTLRIAPDGTLAVIAGMRSDYFTLGGSVPDAPDLFLTLTGFPLETGGVPRVLSRSPASASAGSPILLMTVGGTGFVPGAVVRWNGANLSTVFVSRTKLQAVIEAEKLSAPNVALLRVVNPGGGASAQVSFTVN